MITDACERSSGRYLPEDVMDAVAEKRWQLWLARTPENRIQAVIVTSISIYPQTKALRIRMVMGDEREVWEGAILELERWGRTNGCRLVEGEARLGWARIAKQYGYRNTHTILEKDI